MTKPRKPVDPAVDCEMCGSNVEEREPVLVDAGTLVALDCGVGIPGAWAKHADLPRMGRLETTRMMVCDTCHAGYLSR